MPVTPNILRRMEVRVNSNIPGTESVELCRKKALGHTPKKDVIIMDYKLGPSDIFHWFAIMSLALSVYVALVSAFWWGGWLTWAPGWLSNFLGLAVLFGPVITVPLAIAATLFALFLVGKPSHRADLFLAIPALLIALLTVKWLYDNWPAN